MALSFILAYVYAIVEGRRGEKRRGADGWNGAKVSVVELQSALFMGTMSGPCSLNSEWQRQRLRPYPVTGSPYRDPPTTEINKIGHGGSLTTTQDMAVD